MENGLSCQRKGLLSKNLRQISGDETGFTCTQSTSMDVYLSDMKLIIHVYISSHMSQEMRLWYWNCLPGLRNDHVSNLLTRSISIFQMGSKVNSSGWVWTINNLRQFSEKLIKVPNLQLAGFPYQN